MRIICWNVNGLRSRLQVNEQAISSFLCDKSPDLFFLSEVRLIGGAGKQQNLSTMDKKTREESELLNHALKSGCFANYETFLSLHPTKRYSGTAMFIKTGSPAPINIWYHLPDAETLKGASTTCHHHPEGRIIVAEFDTFYVLHTYSPNNGSDLKGFHRRIAWDSLVTNWLALMSTNPKHVVYLGDLNCAPCKDRDVSHPEWFAKQNSKPGIDLNDRGQPGVTKNERIRFEHMVQEGNLVDIYREFENQGKFEERFQKYDQNITAPRFTWRGHPGKAGNPMAGKFFMKGMRIDHVLVSKGLMNNVEDIEICGQGKGSNDPSFMGSDHCPLLLSIRSNSKGLMNNVEDIEICGQGKGSNDPSFMGSDHCPLLLSLRSNSKE